MISAEIVTATTIVTWIVIALVATILIATGTSTGQPGNRAEIATTTGTISTGVLPNFRPDIACTTEMTSIGTDRATGSPPFWRASP